MLRKTNPSALPLAFVTLPAAHGLAADAHT
jgi:hypothetical protein